MADPLPLHLFLIDDDATLRQSLGEALRHGGRFRVSCADLARGLPDADADAVLLGVDGPAARAALRARQSRAPLLALVGDGGGPPEGADAALAKPVRLAELLAAVDALIRPREARRIGRWEFAVLSKQLRDPGTGRTVRLTEKEAAILARLAASSDPVPRTDLLTEIWGYGAGVATHTLETHIYRLRRKLGTDASGAPLLVTATGGYCLAR